MREAIEEFMKKARKREQFLRDALAAWDDYQATGLYVTGEEIGAWLLKLEAGRNLAPPRCRTGY